MQSDAIPPRSRRSSLPFPTGFGLVTEFDRHIVESPDQTFGLLTSGVRGEHQPAVGDPPGHARSAKPSPIGEEAVKDDAAARDWVWGSEAEYEAQKALLALLED